MYGFADSWISVFTLCLQWWNQDPIIQLLHNTAVPFNFMALDTVFQLHCFSFSSPPLSLLSYSFSAQKAAVYSRNEWNEWWWLLCLCSVWKLEVSKSQLTHCVLLLSGQTCWLICQKQHTDVVLLIWDLRSMTYFHPIESRWWFVIWTTVGVCVAAEQSELSGLYNKKYFASPRLESFGV